MADEQAKDVALADAVKALRNELAVALEAGKDEKIKFEVGPIELEFEVAVSNEGGGSGGVKFWLISLEGKAAKTKTKTHTVKVKLNPKGGLTVSDPQDTKPN
jgi:hypothetical protein